MKKLTLLLFLICGALHAQTNHYTASASSTSLRLQMPAAQGAPLVEFPAAGVAGASVTCASADTATITVNGSAATTTAVTPAMLPPTTRPPGVSAFSASNGSAGTTVGAVAVPAAVTQGIFLGWIKMGASGTGNNITITTSGTCVITFMWSEAL